MTAVFLKSDCEPASQLANIEKAVETFLTILSPTTKVDTAYNPGDVVINVTSLDRHAGAAGYHLLLNGVPTAFINPNQVGGVWGFYRPAIYGKDIYATVLGKRIVIRKGKLRTAEKFLPGVITIIAHEIAEALADVDLETYSAPNLLGQSWLVEPCDWVEGTFFTRVIDGQTVVFPNVALLPAFTDIANKTGPYDLMGLVKAPFQCVGSGKMAWGKDPVTGQLVRFV